MPKTAFVTGATSGFGAACARLFAAHGWSLIVETDYATSLLSDVARWKGFHWYLNVGAKVDVGPGATLELGFTENLVDQQATADVVGYFGLELRR